MGPGEAPLRIDLRCCDRQQVLKESTLLAPHVHGTLLAFTVHDLRDLTWQVGMSHQELVDCTRRLAPFANRPHHQ